MGGHVVGTFIVMLVRPALGRDAGEIGFEVAPRRRSGIFLDQERCRRVAAENRQQTVANAASGDKFAHVIGDFMQPGRLARIARERLVWRTIAVALAQVSAPRQRMKTTAHEQKQKRPPRGERFLSL